MRGLRPTVPTLLLSLSLFAAGAPAAFAAECDNSGGSSYLPPYTSPIGLPRCSGTIGRWTVCEVCQISNATYTADQAYTLSYPTSGTGLQPKATFTQGTTSLTVNGFLDGLTVDGHAIFRVRFAPTTNSGTWNFSATSSDSGLAFSTRSLTAGTSTSKGFLRRHGSSPQRFIYDDGSTRLFMWGNTYYQMVDNARAGTAWKTSVDQNALNSINKIRLLLYPWWQYYTGYPDSQPFQGGATTPNHDLLDLTHWQTFDGVVDYMRQKPMLSEIIVFKDPALDGSGTVLDNCRTFGATQDQDQRYLRYTLARFGAFPNVIWSLANEYGAINVPACTATRSWLNGISSLQTYFNTMGSILRNEDPWNAVSTNPRALTIHQQPSATWDFLTATWPAHASLQFGTNQTSCSRCGGANSCAGNNGDDWGNFSIVNNLSNCSGTPYNLPVVNDEFGYIGKIASVDKHRHAAWGIAAAGGYGSEGDTNAAANTAQVVLYGDWVNEGSYYSDIKRMLGYIPVQTNWFQMSSDNGVVTGGTRVYAMSKPGVQYLVYAAAGGSVTLNLPAPSGTNYAVFQWDPRTGGGAETSLGTVGSGSHTFSLTTAHDWVLRLKAQ
jgi:hypothetical protein